METLNIADEDLLHVQEQHMIYPQLENKFPYENQFVVRIV